MLCGEHSLVKETETGGVAVTLFCRSWLCEECAPKRKRQLTDLAINGTPTKFVTLTASPAVGESPADRAKMLARAWRLVVARAKRQLQVGNVNYLAVFEATKRGEPHLHILLRCGYIPQRWLSQQLRDIMQSPIVDIRAVKSPRHVAHYIAKYVGKAPHHFGTCKRYWHTKGWVVVPKSEADINPWGPGTWLVEKMSLAGIRSGWEVQRYTVIEVSKHEIAYQVPPWMREAREPRPPPKRFSDACVYLGPAWGVRWP